MAPQREMEIVAVEETDNCNVGVETRGAAARKRASSRDALASMERRLDRVEGSVKEFQEAMEDLEVRFSKLEFFKDEGIESQTNLEISQTKVED